MKAYTAAIIDLYRRGHYNLITDHNGKTFGAQKQALRLLNDNTTTEILFGGGAGGSKSFTGWAWVILNSLAYDYTHYFVARDTLKDLRLYGMQTFFEVVDFLQLEPGDYHINNQDSFIEFKNRSKIYLLECKKKPSDRDFHGLGSSLFTSGFIEEAGEVHFDAYDTLCSRVNRWRNKEHGILGKIFITCNPSKNWLYTNFYLPAQNGKLPPNQMYLPALAKDNPYCPALYVERLSRLKDPIRRARLYLGDWNYDDDPTVLIDYQIINNLFTNSHVQKSGRKYIVVDVARFGKDKTVLGVFDGLVLVELITLEKSALTQVQAIITALRLKYQIPASDVIVDESGIGGGVVDSLGVLGFIGNAKPSDAGYKMLKDECGYKLAELAPSIFIECELPAEVEEAIRVQLGQLKTYESDKDTKVRILPKEKIIDAIGVSPDYLDIFIMRMYFELPFGFSFGGFARK